MLTRKEIDGFLTGKLHFQDDGGRSHACYRLYCNAQQVNIPTFPVLPRHAGDVTRTVEKKTAAAFGLNCHRLNVGARCEISAHCVYLCLTAKVFGVGMNHYLRDPTTYQHLPPLVNGTATAVLKLAGGCEPTWTRYGVEAVLAVRQTYLEGLKVHQHVLPALVEWEAFARVGCGDQL